MHNNDSTELTQKDQEDYEVRSMEYCLTMGLLRLCITDEDKHDVIDPNKYSSGLSGRTIPERNMGRVAGVGQQKLLRVGNQRSSVPKRAGTRQHTQQKSKSD